MEHTLPEELPVPDADVDAALARIIQQIEAIRAVIQADDAEIDRLKAESATLKDETRAILATLPLPE